MGRFQFIHTIYGVDGEHRTPYMTRVWLGRLRLHIFHRGDADPDCHDHPWPFWTFPLTSYVEEVAEPVWPPRVPGGPEFKLRRQVVRAFRIHYRPATHCHRVLGRYPGYVIGKRTGYHFEEPGLNGEYVPPHRALDPENYRLAPVPGRIITLVWRGSGERKWGFLKNRDGQWCWTPWRAYVFGGGKHAPCEPKKGGDL